jgi:hypothetical protein
MTDGRRTHHSGCIRGLRQRTGPEQFAMSTASDWRLAFGCLARELVLARAVYEIGQWGMRATSEKWAMAVGLINHLSLRNRFAVPTARFLTGTGTRADADGVGQVGSSVWRCCARLSSTVPYWLPSSSGRRVPRGIVQLFMIAHFNSYSATPCATTPSGGHSTTIKWSYASNPVCLKQTHWERSCAVRAAGNVTCIRRG